MPARQKLIVSALRALEALFEIIIIKSFAKKKKWGNYRFQANGKVYHSPSGMRASHRSYIKVELTVICLCCFYQRAMDVVGFHSDEKSSIYSLLSAILNLGNVTFDEGDDHSAGHDFVSLSNGECKLKSSNSDPSFDFFPFPVALR